MNDIDEKHKAIESNSMGEHNNHLARSKDDADKSIGVQEIDHRVVISNTIWKFFERIAAQLVSLVVSVILARILLPTDYGIVSMVIIFITIANVLVSSGIPSSLVQKKDSDNKDFSSVFFFNLVFSVLVYFVLFFTAPYIAQFFNMPQLQIVLRVLGLQVIFTAFKSVIHSFVSKYFLFRKYFWVTFIGTALSGVVGIIMALCGCGVWALIAQYLTNSLTDTILLWFTVKWRPEWYFSFQRVKKLISFGWKLLFESISSTIVGEIRNLIIGKVYSSADLAFYNKGQQFPKLIVTNVSSSINSVLFPAVATIQDDQQRVVALLRKSIRLISYVAFPLLTGLAIVAPQFISLLLTDKWLECVPFLRISCFTFALQLGMVPRHQALNGTGRSDVFMIEHMISRVIGLVLLFLVYKKSVLAIALTSIVTGLILTVTVFYTSWKYNNYKLKDQIKDVLPSMVGCLLFAVPVFFMGKIQIHASLLLGLQIITGILLYWTYSIVFKVPEYYFCTNFIKNLLSRIKRERE